jgi:hypothetical protein
MRTRRIPFALVAGVAVGAMAVVAGVWISTLAELLLGSR